MICFLQNELINKKHSTVFCSSLYAQLLHFWPGVVVEEPDGPVGDDKEDGGEREDKVGHEVAQHQRPPVIGRSGKEGFAHFSSTPRDLVEMSGYTRAAEQDQLTFIFYRPHPWSSSWAW